MSAPPSLARRSVEGGGAVVRRSPRRARLCAVASGKGGVGKSSLVANLAVASAALGGRVLIVDGDAGLSNLDLLLGLAPLRNVTDVLSGCCELDEAIVEGPRGIHLLPAGSGGEGLAMLGREGIRQLIDMLRLQAEQYDLMWIDVGAGIGPQVTLLAAACDCVLLVATPEPTSLADAYASCKLLWQIEPELAISVVINDVHAATEGRRAYEALRQMSERFLSRRLPLSGVISHDPRLIQAVAEQCAVVERYPQSISAGQLTALAANFLEERRNEEKRNSK